MQKEMQLKTEKQLKVVFDYDRQQDPHEFLMRLFRLHLADQVEFLNLFSVTYVIEHYLDPLGEQLELQEQLVHMPII
jgi:hypothetical protein